MNFNETSEFKKDFKQLSKKYRSLSRDLFEFKKIVSEFPFGAGKHFVVLSKTEAVEIVKARFFCRYLKRSSLRIIYAYCSTKQIVEFVEIYFKGGKRNEDRQRIRDYLKKTVKNCKKT